MKRNIQFTKMHGAGNDYVYIDTHRFEIKNPEALSIVWSDRHKGIGGDGIILIGAPDELLKSPYYTPEAYPGAEKPSEVAEFSMRIFNNDGSEGRMCGNGTRCVAKYLYDKGLTTDTVIRLATLDGVKILHLHLGEDDKVEEVTVDMGIPAHAVPTQCASADGSLTEADVEATSGKTYTGTFVSTGNPHFVIFVDDVEKFDLEHEGPTMEHAQMFPERCNIEFATLQKDNTIRMRVWERGSGITMACGTGACATAVAAAVTKRCGRQSRIVMDGGILSIDWAENGHIMMTGPATIAFEGSAEIEE